MYNSEKYIEKCIKSILDQTLKEIEIIVVNDGSSDNSLKILQKFKNNKNLKIINQENAGVSKARNRGMKEAIGMYIGFVDADDYIDKNMYRNMYEKAKQYNSEIVVCNVNDIVGDKKTKSLELEEGLIDIRKITVKEFLKNKYFTLGNAVWHKIFKASLIEENNIHFINYNEVESEDTIFNYMAMVKANNIYCLDETLYNYISVENSLTKKKESKKNMLNRCKNTVKIISEYSNDNAIEVDKFINYMTYYEFTNALSYVGELQIKVIKEYIKEYSNVEAFKSSLFYLVFSNKLDIYFKSHKDNYSTVYKIFDKIFALSCLLGFYNISSVMHGLRLKRTQKIQNT